MILIIFKKIFHESEMLLVIIFFFFTVTAFRILGCSSLIRSHRSLMSLGSMNLLVINFDVKIN